MKLSSIALVSFILTSEAFASSVSSQDSAFSQISVSSQKQNAQINLLPSNLYVKCGSAEYVSKELDEAASVACNRMVTQGKVMGFRVKSMPKIYEGNLLREYDEGSHSSHVTYDHRAHIWKWEPYPLLMWPLKNKFTYLKAKCYAIIKWNPKRAKCVAIAAILREHGRDDEICSAIAIRDSNSRYAGSSIYHPQNPSLHNSDTSPDNEAGRRASSLHDTTRAPPFNSNFHQSPKGMSRTPPPSPKRMSRTPPPSPKGMYQIPPPSPKEMYQIPPPSPKEMFRTPLPRKYHRGSTSYEITEELN